MRQVVVDQAKRAVLENEADTGRRGLGGSAKWLLILPSLAYLIVFFVLPVLNLFAISLAESPRATTPAGLTIQHYLHFLGDSFYWEVLLKTLRLAATSTLIALVVAYPVAYYMVRVGGRRRTLLTLVILAPLLISTVSRTYGWMLLLAPSGVIPRILGGVGITELPKLLFTDFAIVAGLSHVFLPYMVLALSASLQNVDPALLQAAENLGASKLTAFRRVTWPLSIPGVLAGSIIVFLLSLSAFTTPALLGGPQNKLMSYLVYQQAVALFQWPFGAAIAFILMAITFTLLVGVLRVVDRARVGVVS